MTRYRRLVRDLRQCAKWRGHKIGNGKPIWLPSYATDATGKDLPDRLVGYLLECKNCGKRGTVDLNPLPNGIDIGGEIVAIGCND